MTSMTTTAVPPTTSTVRTVPAARTAPTPAPKPPGVTTTPSEPTVPAGSSGPAPILAPCADRAITPAAPGRSGPGGRWHGARVAARLAAAHRRGHDLGMATAEYAIATLAACGFAGLLVTLLRSGEVKGLLFGIVRRALSTV